MKIAFCVSCHNFQRRLCGQLSSILQQKTFYRTESDLPEQARAIELPIPQIAISVAMVAGNGRPTTAQVIDNFKDRGLDIRSMTVDKETMERRGLVRNFQVRQMLEEIPDFFLFADCDIAYHPHFFADLGHRLSTDLKDEKRCIVASRVSLDKQHCVNAFREFGIKCEGKPMVIDQITDQLASWPVNEDNGPTGLSRNVGAGYFQLASAVRLAELGCYYVPPEECRRDRKDVYRTDRTFRQRLAGGTNDMCKIETLPQYHLNHFRAGDLEHIEGEQL